MRDHLEAVRQRFIAESGNLKALARAMAHEQAIELRTTTKPERGHQTRSGACHHPNGVCGSGGANRGRRLVFPRRRECGAMMTHSLARGDNDPVLVSLSLPKNFPNLLDSFTKSKGERL